MEVAVSILLAGIALVPLFPFSISVGAYLILVSISFVPGDFAPAVSIGFYNILKGVLIPTVLLLRTRWLGLKIVFRSRLFLLWVSFIVYASIATLWTSFPVPALKQLGYLYTYAISFLVFFYLYCKNKNLVYGIISWSTLLTIGITFLSFAMGIWGRDRRFNILVSPQNLGLSFSLLVGILLAFPTKYVHKRVPQFILVPLLLVVIYLSESRLGLIFTFCVFVIHVTKVFLIKRFSYAKGVIFALFCAIGILIVLIGINMPLHSVQSLLMNSRPLQTIAVGLYSDYSLDDIGTARFRLNMYRIVLERWAVQGNHLFGNGTASAGELITENYIYYRGYNIFTVDSNRVVHNVYLRVLYEWGVLGLVLFLSFISGFLYLGFKAARRSKDDQAYMLMGLFMLMVSILFVSTNILAASTTPLGILIAMVFAQLACLEK